MSKLIIGAVLSFVAAVLLIVWQIREIPSRTRPIIFDVASELLGNSMTTITTNWTSAVGEHSITTAQLPDESYAAFLRRHQAAVSAAQEIYPPIK